MTRIEFPRAKWLPLIMTFLIAIAVSMPYLIAVAKKEVGFFIPTISHAAAFPPQAALLSIFMTIGAFFGIMTFALRYVSIEHRRNTMSPPKIKILNVACLIIGLIANISMVFASHSPLGYVTHTALDWVISVVVPHFLGTGALFLCFTFYVLIQTYLTYAQRKISEKNIFGHATLTMCVVITNWTTCIPMYAAIRELLPNIVNETTGEINLETKEYNFYYIISAMSEWAFTFFSLLFIATFYRDIKMMKISAILRPKRIKIDTIEQVPKSLNNEEVTKM